MGVDYSARSMCGVLLTEAEADLLEEQVRDTPPQGIAVRQLAGYDGDYVYCLCFEQSFQRSDEAEYHELNWQITKEDVRAMRGTVHQHLGESREVEIRWYVGLLVD